VCRASAGVCDVEEQCNGYSASCPSDAYAANGTVCRAAADQCDDPEYCTGKSITCPPDFVRTNVFAYRCGTSLYSCGIVTPDDLNSSSSAWVYGTCTTDTVTQAFQLKYPDCLTDPSAGCVQSTCANGQEFTHMVRGRCLSGTQTCDSKVVASAYTTHYPVCYNEADQTASGPADNYGDYKDDSYYGYKHPSYGKW
jgi:hypothetical protein